MADETAKVALKCMEAKDTGIADLSHCKLVQVPPAIFVVLAKVRLIKIDLSYNSLKKIPSGIAQCFPMLQEFKCSHNKGVLKLPHEFSLLEELNYLDLAHNSFDSIPGVPSSLKRLNLTGNLITTVDPDDIERVHHVEEICLIDNNLDDESKFHLCKYKNFTLQ